MLTAGHLMKSGDDVCTFCGEPIFYMDGMSDTEHAKREQAELEEEE